MQFTAQHSLLSVSYCSKIPGHTKPVCLVRSDGEESLEVAKLVNKFVGELSTHASTLQDVAEEDR